MWAQHIISLMAIVFAGTAATLPVAIMNTGTSSRVAGLSTAKPSQPLKLGKVCGHVTLVPGAAGFSPTGVSTDVGLTLSGQKAKRLTTKSTVAGDFTFSNVPYGLYTLNTPKYGDGVKATVTVSSPECSPVELTINAP